MTVKSKRILVALILGLVIAATVTLSVFCFIPDFDVNSFGEFYQSPLTAVQKSREFTDTVKATYTLKLDEEVEGASADNVIKAIQTRLDKAYGYYGSGVEYDADKGLLTIEIPATGNKNTQVKPSAQTILSNVIVNGKVEILSTQYSGSSASYSADSVVVSQEHFRGASVRSYISGDAKVYVCSVKLTKEGKELAEQSLTEQTPYTCFIDEEFQSCWVYRSGGELTINFYYGDEVTSSEHANAMAAYVSSGSLNATLTQEGSTETVTNNLGWIYLLVFGLVVLASFVFFVVRYKELGLIPVVTQLLAVAVYMFFGALVYLEIFNVAMAVGVIAAYAFMTVFSALAFEKLRKLMGGGKNYAVARYQALAFSRDNRRDLFTSLIAHGALLVLGIILWVIPTVVTVPLGNAFVYGAVLSLVVTFGLNRLFARMIVPFFDVSGGRSKSKK